MNVYEVGQVIEKFKYHQEGVQFDMADDGATVLIFFQDPSPDEIEQFKSGKSFEIRFAVLYDVIMLTVKIGNLNWMDAPYNPHLSKNLTKFEVSMDNQGLGLTLMLIDASTGEIKHMRVLGLSERFTRELFAVVVRQKMSSFDNVKYTNNVNRVFNSYDTKDIVKMSKIYCRMN